MDGRVTAFTDTYLPTVNGVTYTIRTWKEHWTANGGRMDVVYPHTDGYVPDTGEIPVRSAPFPLYDGFRLAVPTVPDSVASGETDLVHAHTPFSMGLAGLRLARSRNVPLVATYHTPAGEYAGYLAPTELLTDGIRGTAETYERLFFDRADLLVVPSKTTMRHVKRQVGVSTRVEVVSNGVEIDRFRPVDPGDFLAEYDLDGDAPLVGYTGRHGYEKDLDVLVDAARGLDATVVLAGDGPAREDLRERAAGTDADVRFPGFLDRSNLPAFYSALDAFAFPSPVETQGLVALEANACGTPVAGVDSGALADTVDHGETGYHAPPDDPRAFRQAIRRTLDDRERLSANCLERRGEMSVERSIERLSTLYDELV